MVPATGTVLCRLDELPDGDAREFRFGEGRRVFSMLVLRRGGGVRAYVNACPHVWLPLTYRGGSVVSADGARLVCSNHQAEFAVEDGRALGGPVEADCRLTPVPVAVGDDGVVRVGG
ncbi:Rieske (2Fe-2S) protein [Azospirillum rugosum]|uniref:Nitrite reductase/ring-hydroxylating ferredoxin subunit n=1 Tax=Azospirillum rugosum TaxID=416170 RepID=A0ABS4SVG7_9PROT|nr:Rieske 2Fe-2S domain-containing protein [Azospirillum rugosum]MBP2296549.1 nitrite reductase/ring-hydroxylating ferredoxin subunit [Azospirillum rugosum]MDQ0530051.1 nitrite reductase/ring-hydroxylating ferredoxin subunit [Azospirillum rugosum]